MPVERAVRIMLANLASFDDLPLGDRMSTEHVRRRQGLLDDFRRTPADGSRTYRER
jgi:ATP/maltotriose-dependent transcriptional regulator MalT